MPRKIEILIYCVIICIGAGSVYLYKLNFSKLQVITHEDAMPWYVLEDSYKALGGFTSFYGKTLEKLKKLEHEKVALYGYMYPIKMAQTHDHFLLSRQAHICNFHIPAHSGNMVEVIMKDSSLPFSPHPILLTGTFSIPNDKELGITFRLEDAELVDD